MNPPKDLQEEVRSLTNNLKSSQAMEQQTADREANLEEKIAKVNSYLSYLSPSIGDFDEKMIPPESYNTISV